MYLNRNFFLILFLFLFSCQPLEFIAPIDFDNSNLKKTSINANTIIIKNNYSPSFSENNIEYQLSSPPVSRIQNWIEQNISKFGNQNKFYINILDASISRIEINNENAKSFEEKKLYQYEIFILVEYELYNDSNYLLANTTVETSRSTTSQKYISINETELIINDLIFNSLIDFSNESILMLQKYMGEYLN
tara:strand:+ start:284 stop:856 length:573 start_codon:yes stop_codon:yes gene_type:complete